MLLTANLLRFYSDFESMMQQEPGNLYTDSTHPFVARVHVALGISNVSQAVFVAWQKEIKEGFTVNNYLFLRFSEVSQGGLDVCVDPRTITSMMGMMSATIVDLGQIVGVLSEQISLLVNKIRNRPSPAIASEKSTTVSTFVDGVLPISLRGHTINDLLFEWYYYDYPAVYEMKKHQQRISGTKRRNTFSQMKKVVKGLII